MRKRKHTDQNYSIDITDSEPALDLPEVINLADDSPPSTSGRDQKADGAPAPAVVDNNQPSEAEQKGKIMAHALMVNSRKRNKLSPDPEAVATSSSAGKDEASDQPNSNQDAAKQAIMQHATQLNANNSLLAQLHAERLARQQLAKPKHAAEQDTQTGSKQDKSHNPPITELKLLTYNVWFEEDVALQERMSAIGDIIQEQGYPHFMCFQEVTPNIYHIFEHSAWWHRYAASAPAAQPYFTALLYRRDTFKPSGAFQTHHFFSRMGRGLLSISGTVQGHQLTVATSHLESPCGHQQMFSKERVAQCKEGFSLLDKQASPADVLWAGDMNWNTEDGNPPLPAGWVDAWTKQNPKDPGLTYDGKANAMLGPYNRLRKRLDRIFCRTTRFKLASISMVGTQAIPGLTHTKSYKKGLTVLPVLPSDHFGLLASFCTDQ